MKKITSFSINSSNLLGSGEARGYTIEGDPKAAFSMIIINQSGEFYNFPENTTVSVEEGVFTPSGSFSSTPTRLGTKKINNSGVYNGVINFPAISSDEKYTVVLQAETYLKTEFDESLSLNAVYHAAEISQFLDTTVVFAVASTGTTYSTNIASTDHNGDATAEATTRYAVTGPSTSVTNQKFTQPISLSWNVALSSSNFVIARQPVINDFYFQTKKDTFSAGSGKILELKDVSGLTVGMAVSGTGIAANSTITEVNLGYKNENKSVATKSVYTIPKDINVDTKSIVDSKGGTITLSENTTSQAVDRTITFKGFGSSGSSAFNNTVFTIKNFNLTIEPVVTTTTGAVAATATVIPVASADGIKDDVSTVSGIGINSANTMTVTGISSLNMTVRALVAAQNEALENGQTVTFTGSGTKAAITADIEVEKYGKDNLVLILELDNILTVE